MFLDYFSLNLEAYISNQFGDVHMFRLPVTTALFLLISFPVLAHEYWLEADNYTPTMDQDMQVRIFVGQKFKGNEYPFNPTQHIRYGIVDSAGYRDYEGVVGDKPSLSAQPLNSGLNVIVNISNTQILKYDEWEKFESFVTHAGLDGVLEAHRARGLPETGFGEGYTRFVKSLIGVDGGAGSDVQIGMQLEIVVLANPYTDDLSRGLPVRVLHRGVPLPNAQIEIFRKGIEETELVRTNRNGLVMIPVESGVYMLNTVKMVIPPEDDQERTGAVWHSLWASTTFEVPTP